MGVESLLRACRSCDGQPASKGWPLLLRLSSLPMGDRSERARLLAKVDGLDYNAIAARCPSLLRCSEVFLVIRRHDQALAQRASVGRCSIFPA